MEGLTEILIVNAEMTVRLSGKEMFFGRRLISRENIQPGDRFKIYKNRFGDICLTRSEDGLEVFARNKTQRVLYSVDLVRHIGSGIGTYFVTVKQYGELRVIEIGRKVN